MWASLKDDGDSHGSLLRGLTSTDSTLIVVPEEESIHEKFRALVNQKETLMKMTSSEFDLISTSATRASRRDYANEFARPTCVANLHAMSKHPKHDASSTLYCVEAGFAKIMLKVGSETLQLSDLQTKDGSRIWLDVYLRDLSGGVTCKMGQDVALQLTECADPDAFFKHLQKGNTSLPLRSYKVLVSHSTVDGAVYVNLTIVHAGAPTLPSISRPEYTNSHGLMVAEIRHLGKNQFGNMVLGIKEKPVSAELVLVVLQGTKDATCEQRDSDVFVCNLMVQDLLSSDDSPFPVPVVTAVPLSNVPSMSLHAGRKVIAAVSDVFMRSETEVLEVHANAMFTVTDDHIKLMKEFLRVSVDFATNTAGVRKRPWREVNPDYISSLDDDPEALK